MLLLTAEQLVYRLSPVYLIVPGRNYRFVAMASDITHGRLSRLPWDYPERFGLNPDEVPVVEAVRASMAIPYFFTPARCPDRIEGGTAWMVDGGMLSNFPVDVFDRTDNTQPRWRTFGIKLSARPGQWQNQRRPRNRHLVQGDALHHDRILRPDTR